MKQFGSPKSGWPAGSGSGSVTSRPAPPMVPERSATTRSSVTTWAPRATLINQAWRSMRDSSSALMMPIVSGVSAEREEHRVGAGERVVVAVGLQHVVGAVHGLHPVADHGDVAVEGLQQPQERLGDPAAAEDRHPAAEEVAALWRLPLVGTGVRAEAPQPGHGQRQRQLRDRLGVDALAARPEALVVDEVHVLLDPGERQLDPTEVRSVVEGIGQAGGIAGVGPDRAPPPCRAGTRWPPPSMMAVCSHSGAPSGARAMRGGLRLGWRVVLGMCRRTLALAAARRGKPFMTPSLPGGRSRRESPWR